jgi:hypothetical protein
MARIDRDNPQAEQMADESMVRTLRAQADALWPQEAPLFDRYAIGEGSRILDAGCKIETDPRRYRVVVVPTGQTLAKMAFGSEEIDYNMALITALGGTRAKLEDEVAALREARRFL